MRNELYYKSQFRSRDTSNSLLCCNYRGSGFISGRHQPWDLSKKKKISKEKSTANKRRQRERALEPKRKKKKTSANVWVRGLSTGCQISGFKRGTQVGTKGRLDCLQALLIFSPNFSVGRLWIPAKDPANSFRCLYFIWRPAVDQRISRQIF